MKFVISYSIAIFVIITFWSCGNDESCEKINKIIANKVKTDADFDQLLKLLHRNTNCPDSLLIKNGIISGNVLNENKLRDFYFNKFETEGSKTKEIKVNIFLENSASMWGYFEGATECEKAMSKIVIHSGYFFGKKDLKFSFITDSVHEPTIEEDVLKFVSRIEPQQLKVGNYTNTEISDILKTVIDKTGKENFSILITDCIYSKQPTGSTNQTINFEWTLIEDAFLTKLNDSKISVLINKYTSNYKGYYVSMDNSNDQKVVNKVGFDKLFYRPYYVIAIGESDLMESALEEIDFKSYPGYQFSYLISQPKSTDQLNYRILNSFKKGSFKPDKKDQKHTLVNAQKATRGHDKGIFQFTIAVDLSELRIEQDYILDPNKYKISSDYEIKIQTISEDMHNKDKQLGGYTHLISLQSKSNLKEETIKLSLKRETPRWVLDTHTEEDLKLDSLHQTKTRGFKYLVEGIVSAFDKAQNKARRENDLKYYFTLNVNIKL